MPHNALSRRQLLAGSASFLAAYHARAETAKGKTKIRDIRTMVVQGPDRNYVFVKVISDAGLSGIGEAPGVGVKEQIHALRIDASPSILNRAQLFS